jgi:hypothetical protein
MSFFWKENKFRNAQISVLGEVWLALVTEDGLEEGNASGPGSRNRTVKCKELVEFSKTLGEDAPKY